MISSILPAILPTVGKLVDKLFPDEEAAKREKLKIEQELLKQLQSVDLAQIDVNKVEAAGNRLGLCLGFCLPLLGAADDCFHSQYIGASNSIA